MEEEKNLDFKIKNNSVQNNSNPRPGPSNLHSSPDSSNSYPGPYSSSKCKIPKKRLLLDNNDWGWNSKLIKREIPVKVKKEGNSGIERPSENSEATMSQKSQQQMAVEKPESCQPQTSYQQAIPNPLYGYNTSENNHVHSNQRAYAVNPFPSMMPINSQLPASNALPATASSVASTSGMEMVVPANGSLSAYPYVNMGNSDGSLYPMLPIINIPNFTSYPPMGSIVPMLNNLEPVTITHAVLTPPLPGERRSRQEKPPGCRTVFVGNLPEKITEDIIKEAFELCGPISAIRMNKRKFKKSFCHIRFVNMESVEQALLLSGFRIRIDKNEDAAFNGKLHVDYANDKDDQNDYELLERARQWEERSSSPPPIPHFSEHEAQTLADRLRNKETFLEGSKVLVTWLDRGECNKRNSGTIFSLFQSLFSHVKRLRNERRKHEEEAREFQDRSVNIKRNSGKDLTVIAEAFVVAKKQKVWDQFTKNQRKIIEKMKCDTFNLKETNSKDLLGHRVEEDMELSDNEGRNDNEENGGVLQLAATEELITLRERVKSLTEKQDINHQTIEVLKDRCSEQNDEIVRLRIELNEREKIEKSDNFNDSATQCSTDTMDDAENDPQLISLISIFLHAHPFGASFDCIYSYLVEKIPSINAKDVECLLRRYPRVFREVYIVIGAAREKKWTFMGFKDQK